MRVVALLFVCSLLHIPVRKISEKSIIQVIHHDPLILDLNDRLDLQFHLYNVEGTDLLHWQEMGLGPGVVQPDCPWEAIEEGIYYLKIQSQQDSAVAKVIIR